MNRSPIAFKDPLYVTRPLLPPLDRFMERLGDVWDAKWLTNGGSQHRELEQALARYFSTENLSLFNNGTIALVTACQALRLNGEVITTPFTFPATPHVLSWNGITPVFADIDPVTMNLDPSNIEPLITTRTTAVLAVHVFGTPCDVEGIQEIANRHGLRVIYDAAHAFGTTLNGRMITDWGDASMLSFHATKLFHTAEGGALIVRDKEVKKRVEYLKNFGIRDEYTVIMPGINGKMNELQAALGLLVLDMIDDERRNRLRISDIYAKRLGDIEGVALPHCDDNITKSEQYYPIRINSSVCGVTRDHVYSVLTEYNVKARKYFYPLCSDYSCYRMLPSAQPAYLPVAHNVVDEILCIPYYGGMSSDDAERVCDIIEFSIK